MSNAQPMKKMKGAKKKASSGSGGSFGAMIKKGGKK